MSIGAVLAVIALFIAVLGLLGVATGSTVIWVAILLLACAILVGAAGIAIPNPFHRRPPG